MILIISLLILLSLIILAVAGIVIFYIQNPNLDKSIIDTDTITTNTTNTINTINTANPFLSTNNTTNNTTNTANAVNTATILADPKPLAPISTLDASKTLAPFNNSLVLQYSKYNSDGVEMMDILQEIITELQKEGCAHLMATFDFVQFSNEMKKIYLETEGGVDCEQSAKVLKALINTPETEEQAIYYKKTINLIDLMIDKFVSFSCSNGKIDIDKYIGVVLTMKNTLCGFGDTTAL